VQDNIDKFEHKMANLLLKYGTTKPKEVIQVKLKISVDRGVKISKI
jgi:hypothetical protein